MNNSELINSKMKEIIFRFYGKAENRRIIFIFKSKHEEIKRNLASGGITFTKELKPYEKKICSKLDILKELIKHGKYHPWAKDFMTKEENIASIQSGTNLDIIDAFFSIKQSTFFQGYKSFPLVLYDDESESRKSYYDALIKPNPELPNPPYKEADDYIGLLGEYVSIELSEIIATQMRHTYVITYTDTTIGKTGIIHINTMTELEESFLDELIKKIISNVLIYMYVFDRLRDKELPKVKIYFTGKKKELPPKNNFETVKDYYKYTSGNPKIKEPSNDVTLFTGNYINTALTVPKKDIVIFREEEMLKVLLHECMHYFELINCNTNNPQSVDLDFAIKSSRHDLTETLIETLADIFNAIIISPLDSGVFKDNLAREMEFIFKQAGKILQHSEYENWGQYYKPGNGKDDIKIWETTNMHNYYIMRTLAFFNLDSVFNKAFEYLLPKEKEKEKAIENPECMKIKELLTQLRQLPELEYARIINYFIGQPITDASLRMTMLE